MLSPADPPEPDRLEPDIVRPETVGPLLLTEIEYEIVYFMFKICTKKTAAIVSKILNEIIKDFSRNFGRIIHKVTWYLIFKYSYLVLM